MKYMKKIKYCIHNKCDVTIIRLCSSIEKYPNLTNYTWLSFKDTQV